MLEREIEKSGKDKYTIAVILDNKGKHKSERRNKRKRHAHVFEFLVQNVCYKTFMLVFN